jgi:hypothetical protein
MKERAASPPHGPKYPIMQLPDPAIVSIQLSTRRKTLLANTRKTALLLLIVIAGVVPALAQKTELAIGVGGYFPVNLTGVGTALAIEGTFSHSLVAVPLAAVYLDVPVVGTVKSTVRSFGLTSAASYSALFVAPGLKLKLAPGFFVSPWMAIGGGLAHFGASSGLAALSGTTGSTNTGVFDVGGGLDVKVAPFVSLRGEVRDFYSGGLGLSLATFNQRQHNIITTAGVVLRF